MRQLPRHGDLLWKILQTNIIEKEFFRLFIVTVAQLKIMIQILQISVLQNRF